jgi:hypothetical protein
MWIPAGGEVASDVASVAVEDGLSVDPALAVRLEGRSV